MDLCKGRFKAKMEVQSSQPGEQEAVRGGDAWGRAIEDE